MTPSVVPDRESVAASALSLATIKPQRFDQGASAKSITEKSVRDCGDQISLGRFDPQQFDANIQTDNELLINFMKKPVAVTE